MDLPLVISGSRCLFDADQLASEHVSGKPTIHCYSQWQGIIMQFFGMAYEVKGKDHTVHYLSRKDLESWTAAHGYHAYNRTQVKSAIKHIVANARANHWSAIGDRHRQTNRPQAALLAYNESLCCNPRCPKTLIARAICYRQLTKHAEAIADCSLAINVCPEYDYAWTVRGDSYRILGDHEIAATDLNQALTLNPVNVFALASLAECYRVDGFASEAIHLLTEALAIEPENAFALDAQSNAYLDMAEKQLASGNYDEALELVQQARAQNPNYEKGRQAQIEVFRRRARHWSDLKNHLKAIIDLTDLLKIAPHDANALLQRAACYQKMRCEDQAINDFEMALSLYPGGSEIQQAYSRYCQLEAFGCLQKEDFVAAKRFFLLYLKINPNDAHACAEFGDCLFHMRNYGQAWMYYSKAVQLDPNDCNLRVRKGDCALQTGQFAKALKSFEAAIELNSLQVAANVGAAAASMHLQRYEQAIKYYSVAIALAPSHAEIYYLRALAYCAAQKFSAALKDCDQALASDPTFGRAAGLRASVLQKVSQPSHLWQFFGW